MTLQDLMPKVARVVTKPTFTGESVMFYPLTGSPSAVQAIVRRPGQEDQQEGEAVSQRLVLLIPRDATVGVGVTAINDGDEVGVFLRRQDPIETRCRIVNLDEDAAGQFVVTVEE